MPAWQNMNTCLIAGCNKTDDQKPMAFRGKPYCSDLHRKVLVGEVKIEMVPTVVVPVTNEKSVVE